MSSRTRLTPAIFLLTLLAGPPGAGAQTSFATCRSALEAAGSPGLAAYSTCIRGVIAQQLAGYADAVNAADAARQMSETLTRSSTDYYLVSAGDCAQERSVRGELERHTRALADAIRVLTAGRDRISTMTDEANALLATAVIGGFVSKAANHVQYLLEQTDVTVARIDRQIERARDLLPDLQQTTVENRCGSADPLADTPPTPPAPTPDGTGRTDLPDGSARFDGPTVGGVALSPCLYRAHCSGRDGIDAFCRSQGFERSGNYSQSSHGEVPTRSAASPPRDFPSGSSVVSYVICHP